MYILENLVRKYKMYSEKLTMNGISYILENMFQKFYSRYSINFFLEDCSSEVTSEKW